MPRSPEIPGVKLNTLPQWAADAVVSYSAIDQVYTSLIEDARLEVYDGMTVAQRRQHLMDVKAASRMETKLRVALTGNFLIRKITWNEPSALASADTDERAEFYRPHIENMKRRIVNFVRNLEDAGKKLPKDFGVSAQNGEILLLLPKEAQLFRLKKSELKLPGGATYEYSSVNDRLPADDADWFSVRWEDEILLAANGISMKEKAFIAAHASL